MAKCSMEVWASDETADAIMISLKVLPLEYRRGRPIQAGT